MAETRTDTPLGDAIRDARNESGKTQGEVAGLLGVDQTTVSRWELGRDAPPRHQLGKIERVLHITPGKLFALYAGVDAPEVDPARAEAVAEVLAELEAVKDAATRAQRMLRRLR